MQSIRVLLDYRSVLYSRKVISAVFIVLCCAPASYVNKYVISVYYVNPPYPLFIVGELIVTVALLCFGRWLNLLELPTIDSRVLRRIVPLFIIYFARMATSFDEVDRVDRPLFDISSRFVLLVTMTMFLERVFLGVKASDFTQLSVVVMAAGALITGTHHEGIWMIDFMYIVLNNLCTAAHGVYSKKMLDTRELGVLGLWFYNSIIMLLTYLLLASATEIWYEIHLSVDWGKSLFWCHLFIMCMIGLATSCALILCIHYNGSLTTAVIVSLTKTISTCLGLLNSETVVPSWHYVGLSIIAVSGLAYIFDTFKSKSSDYASVSESISSAQIS